MEINIFRATSVKPDCKVPKDYLLSHKFGMKYANSPIWVIHLFN